jgi:branched-chain amino acid transport system substrate-binding protein
VRSPAHFAALRRPVTPALASLLSVLLLLVATGCGSRRSHAEVVAAAGGQVSTTAPVGTSGGAGTTTTGAAVGGSAGTGTGSSTTGTAAIGTTGGSNGAVAGAATAGATGATTGTGATTASAAQDTTPVVICQVGSFSGIAAPPFANAQPGLAAWVRWTNAHGGVAGHQIVLDSKDDATDPNKAQQIVQNCVENEHAIAVVGAFVPATADAIANYLKARRVPVIGGDDVTSTWFTNSDFFPEGSSQLGTGLGMVRIMLHAHKKAAGIIYCTESIACTQGKDYFEKAAHREGLAVKGTYQVSLANPSFTSQCSLMQRAHIDAIYISLDGPSASRLARDCNAIGYHPFYVTGGLALDAPDAAADPNLNGLAVTTYVFPWVTSASPGARDFHTAMATYAPDVIPTESAAKAWVSGALFAKAIDNVGTAAHKGPLTSAMVLDGLYKMHNEDLGGLVVGHLNYRPDRPVVPDNCWGVAQIQNGKWIAPQGARASCA